MRRNQFPFKTIQLGLSVFLFGSASSALADSRAHGPVVLDGSFDDWNDVPIVLTDPADAPNARIDFGDLRIAHDEQFVDLFVDLGRLANVQQFPGTIWIVLDADGSERTGDTWFDIQGADIAIAFSPVNRAHPDRKRMGIGLLSSTYHPDPSDDSVAPLTLYDVGFTFAPTHASDRIEMRFQRDTRPHGSNRLFLCDHFRGVLAYTDLDNIVRDTTEVFEYALTPAAAPSHEQPLDPLRRLPSTDLRVMSWNVRFGSIVEQREAARRIVRAVRPDVILFQELHSDHSVEMIESVLNESTALHYDVFIGAGGGDLRSGIASRTPINPMHAVEPMANPINPEWMLRTAGVVCRHDNRRILLMSLHLKCCGGIDDPAEATRKREVAAIVRGIDYAQREQPFDAIVIGGDLNLVGGTEPLTMLRSLADDTLHVAAPLQLDGRSNATWHDDQQPFAPGRLDYLLHDDALREVRSFVLDCRDLSGEWLEAHDLRETDAEIISDHWPLVLDLAWR